MSETTQLQEAISTAAGLVASAIMEQAIERVRAGITVGTADYRAPAPRDVTEHASPVGSRRAEQIRLARERYAAKHKVRRSRRSKARPEDLTTWVADQNARRVPRFVIEATGFDTKYAIWARYGKDARFERGKALPPKVSGAKAKPSEARPKVKAHARSKAAPKMKAAAKVVRKPAAKAPAKPKAKARPHRKLSPKPKAPAKAPPNGSTAAAAPASPPPATQPEA